MNGNLDDPSLCSADQANGVRGEANAATSGLSQPSDIPAPATSKQLPNEGNTKT